MADDSDEQLEQRVEQVEQQLSKMLPGRRGVLKGLGAAALGGAAVGGATGGAAGQSGPAGRQGTPENPNDIFAWDLDVANEVVTDLDLGGNELRSGSVSTDELSNIIVVKTESELRGNIASERPLLLDGNITIDGSPVGDGLGAEDVTILLAGHTITAGANRNDAVLDFQNSGSVTISGPGVIDGNRGNQDDFPNTKQPVVRSDGGESIDLSGFEIVENPGFSVDTDGVDYVTVDAVDIKSEASGLTESEAFGLDGLHIRDALEVSITGGNLSTGDDSIAIDAADTNPKRVNIQGVTCSSVAANGVKLLTNSGTTGPTPNNVSVDATVRDVGNKCLIIKDESSGTGSIDKVNISGSYDSVLDGIIVTDAASEININAQVTSDGGIPINITAADEVTISATTNANNNSAHNIKLADCQDVSISGTHKDCNTHTIQVDNTTHVTISGCVLRGFANRPVNVTNGSDFVNIVGNDTDGISPIFNSGTNNNAAQNI